MNRRVRGFTIAELVTVLAITCVLAGLLFPVFISARGSAEKASCLSNFHQVYTATTLYVGDYDDRYMPLNHRPAQPPNAQLDRTWVQVILPYVRSFAVFSCPADHSPRDKPETTFDQDLVPGDTYSQYYTASMHVNLGYNYLYFAPIVRRDGVWTSVTRSATDFADPSKTLVFIDSLWDRSKSGQPYGGGNWIVVPPCRYLDPAVAVGRSIDTFEGPFIYSPLRGWQTNDPESPGVYGNAWPRHFDHVTVARADGSVSSLTIKQLSAGCNIGDSWTGRIHDPQQYLWDLR